MFPNHFLLLLEYCIACLPACLAFFEIFFLFRNTAFCLGDVEVSMCCYHMQEKQHL